MRRLIKFAISLGLLGFGIFWWLTQPVTLPDQAMAGLTGDVSRGEQVFYASGCASCHAAPEAKDDARLVLSGGKKFPSPFGTFLAPNISPDATHGIGGWTATELANAMINGTSPDGAHYFPAFPYTSYAKASLQDIADLSVFLTTLPASDTPSLAHEVGFPFNVRRGLGLWKQLFTGKDWVLTGELSDELIRGRYLVESLGHCTECHTRRNPIGGLDRTAWMGGVATPDGKGKTPNITPAKLTWSKGDIAYYLETGFTPDFDAVGGSMASVVLNTAKLPASDRAAIAAYLKAIPPVE
ncbi:MAG: cytochrome c [Rhodobacteraceae bacterium]|nr:cytochrome c [Paracoccaceae bacterium]